MDAVVKKSNTGSKSLWMLKEKLLTSFLPAHCTHSISTFPFPSRSCLLLWLAVWMKRQSQPARRPRDTGNLTVQLPTDSWQVRRLNKWIHRPRVQGQTGTQLSYSLPLAQHHLWTTAQFISSWQPKHNLWMLLGLIRALLQYQHTVTLPVPTGISPN